MKYKMYVYNHSVRFYRKMEETEATLIPLTLTFRLSAGISIKSGGANKNVDIKLVRTTRF